MYFTNLIELSYYSSKRQRKTPIPLVDLSPKRHESGKPKAEKSVRFSSTQVISLDEYPGEVDASEIFYSKEDIDIMRKEKRRAAKAVRRRHRAISSGILPDNGEFSGFGGCFWVGIESFLTRDIMKKSMKNKAECIRAVLEEQARQRELGQCDPCRLAHVSQIRSKWAVKRAETLGHNHSK